MEFEINESNIQMKKRKHSHMHTKHRQMIQMIKNSRDCEQRLE